MASSKRKQDEKHLKILREMAALPHNKHCFDCHQRGPTYVNMTIGSYICTSCSGILRGLNPPHRVKSISMASFTPEEMDFLKSSGNELCRKTWLGLYDNRSGMEPDSRDEQKVKDFMSQKYERKRFYVAPTDAMKEEAKQMNESPSSKQPQTRPLKSLLGSNTPSLVVQNSQSPQQTSKSAASQPPPVVAPQSKESTPSSFPSPGQQSQSSQSSGSATVDLLGDLGGDPFASAAPAVAAPPVNLGGSGGGGGFADFSSFNQFPAQPSQPNPAFQTASNPLLPMGTSTTINGTILGGVTSAPPPASNTSLPAGGGGDKYSNLADLFSAPVPETKSETATPVNWSGGGGSGTGINWGGGGGGTTDTGISWSSTGTGSSTSGLGGGGSSGGINWGSSSNATSTSIPHSTFPSSGANPFGGGTTVQTQSTVGGANPFGGGSQPLFGQQAGGSFGQPAQSAAGFGQASSGGFGQPAPSAGGFGQPAPVAGGFGQPAPSAGGFGQPAPVAGGFGQQAPSAGAFGQPSSSAGAFGQPSSSAGAFGQPSSSAGAFGQPTSNAGAFGQPSSNLGGFGQPAPSAGGFGQFGATPQQSGNFGQFGVQNGGFGGMGGQVTSASFGAFSQTQTMPAFGSAVSSQGQFDNKMSNTAGGFSQQGFGTAAPGGWGQGTPQAANPFMSAAQQPVQPKSGSTNPFL